MKRDRFWIWQQRNAPYLFVAPFVVLFCTFMLYPLVRSVVLSLYNTSGPRSTRFVGLDNFLFILKDQLFHIALLNTLGYALAGLALQIPLALGLALALNSKKVRGRNVFRFAFFAPHLVGNVFVAVIFLVLLAKNGPVNQAIANVFPAAINFAWVNDPYLARFAVILAMLWMSVGYGMVYFLAALQAVDRELYEAADVDGASPWQKFWHVTLPGIRPVLVFMIFIGTIGGLQLFELPYVLFQGAGPGQAGLTVVNYLFGYGFEAGNLGYASAVAWILVLLIAALTILQLRMLRVKEASA